MGKSDLYRKVTAILRRHLIEFDRQASGSHEMWRCTRTGKKAVVPRNLKARGTANGILKTFGLPDRF